MPTECIRVAAVIPASPDRISQAWLDSALHSAFTGSPATVDSAPGGAFSAWDNYISGTTLEVDPGKRILQAWRTTEFPDGSPDSRLEVLLEPADRGTRVTLVHSEIPEGQGAGYADGWEEYYFEPMRRYFTES